MSEALIPDTEELLARAEAGEPGAVDLLFSRQRPRLRQMVAVWMDPQLSRRLDPSDIVQEAFVDAHRHLPDYLRERPLPFYPWLRQFAWNHLIDLHRRHVVARRRSVLREDPRGISLSEESMERLVRRLGTGQSDPGQRAIREEMRERVRVALETLPPQDREILVMRHLEQLPIKDIAVIQKVAEGTVKSRHFRALEKLRRLLADQEESHE